MEHKDFPRILVCPEPTINIKAMKSLGYSDFSVYMMGIGLKEGLLGWVGNQSESIEEVSTKISVLKSLDDCPIEEQSKIMYNNENEEVIYENLTFKLSNVLYPHHICCEMITPKAASSNHILGFSLSFSFMNKSFDSYKILLSDKLSASKFDIHKTKMLGDKILSKSDIKGFLNYKIEIEEELHLEEDPNYLCIDYTIDGEYTKCLENEHIQKMFKFQNCTPPWMTENKDLWCTGRLQLNASHISSYVKFINELALSDADPGECLVPCTSKKYFSNEIGILGNENINGILIFFDRVVKTTKSELQIGFKTLITRFGGIIGVCKNLLWIVIFGFSSFAFLFNKMSKKTNPETQEKYEQCSMSDGQKVKEVEIAD